jgi:MFS family permease
MKANPMSNRGLNVLYFPALLAFRFILPSLRAPMLRLVSLITPRTDMLNLPRNVWILIVTFSLSMSGISLLMFVGGLIGTKIAPSSDLATLPIATFVVGTAISTIPASLFMQRFGRKAGGYMGLLASLSSAVIALIAINIENFSLFVLGGFFVGIGTSFLQQFRFAVIESLARPEDTGPALSMLMLFNIGGAVLGPELGSIGHHLLPNTAPYSGSFALLILVVILAAVIFSLFKNPPSPEQSDDETSRPLLKIVMQPKFIIALLSAGIGFGVMSFLMTSTPLAMHVHHGYSLNDAKWVIQSHLIAMFLPSLFSGFLIKYFGIGKLMFAGCILYLVVAVVAFSGQALMHYWWALVLLGIGWNFLFLSGTTLLPQSYRHAERFKAQAVNDFSVFSFQAIAALSAAWILFNFGWNIQVLICIPPTLCVLIASFVYIVRHEAKDRAQ